MDDDFADAAQAPYFYVGQHEARRAYPVTDRVLQQAKDCGYDMLTSPISTPHLHDSVWKLLSSYFQELEGGISADEIPPPLLPAFSPAESFLTPGASVGQLVAFTSPWLDLASPDPVIANLSRQVFNQEVAYAAFCGVGHIVVQGPKLYRGKAKGDGIPQYARAMQEALNTGAYVQLHILLPAAAEPEDPATGELGHLASLARPEYRDALAEYQHAVDDTPADGRLLDAWDAWNIVRSVCNYSPRLSVCLDLPRQLPPVWLQSRWYSEPVRILSFRGSTFLTNAKGQPVLPKPHQALIAKFMRLKHAPWILLCDVGPVPGLDDPQLLVTAASGHLTSDAAEDATAGAFPTPAEAAAQSGNGSANSVGDPVAQLSYIRHLQRHQPPKPVIERFGAGYQDYLQAPLQPLTDNLESITYEVFEKDPIKYEWYERAITQALKDWAGEGKPTSAATGAVVVAVVGAGRGPLVTRALNASVNSGVPIELYAVEKNPNAYVLLQRHNVEDWARQVTVIKSDMRSWRGPMRADGSFGHVDIIISELLGSFGDNELSPECLDGVQHVLNPAFGISIPASYTAHLTPIAAPKLHADILARTLSDPSAPETPYVVMLHAIDYLSTLNPLSIDQAGRKSERNLERISEAHMDSANPTTPGSASKAKRHTVHVPSAVSFDTHTPAPYVQTCWSFSHPLPSRILSHAQLRRGGGLAGGVGGSTGGDGANEHNVRFWRGTFPCKKSGVCHGLAGYFETVLYEGVGSWSTVGGDASAAGTGAVADGSTSASNNDNKVELSTNPETMDAKSKDMISWFPIYFPLKTPLYVPDSSELLVSIWRQTDDRKVWYEWLVESFVIVGSRRMRLGVSELHSSKKNGCLM